MATASRIPFKAFKTLIGMSIPREAFPEAATQTFKKGALVYLNAAGYLTECGTDPTLIMGVATKDGGNGTAAGDVTQVVELAHPDTLFVGNLDSSNDEGGATAHTHVTDVGKMYGVWKATTAAKWTVDLYETTNKRVVVWKLRDVIQDGIPMAVGDILGHVIFSFDPQYFQGQRTS
jgi:hypothetical protein